MHNICLTIANISKKGGEERMCTLLANELEKRGHTVIIISQNNYYWQSPFFSANANIRRYSLKRTLLEYGICRFVPNFQYDIKKYHAILKRNNIDIVIDVDTEISLMTSIAKKELNIHQISWEHFCYQRFSSRKESQDIIDCIQKHSDKLVVLTNTDRQLFIENGIMPVNRVQRIYNPSPIECSTKYNHTNKKVLSIGRLEPEKGFDTLLRVWSIIEKRTAEWELEIVGNGSCKENLEGLIKSLNLKRAKISNPVKNPYNKYLEASIYALPSRHEGLSLALLEAANMCLPLLAFDCPNGPREIVIDGINGYLIEPDNMLLFAEKLLFLMSNPQKCQELGNNAQESVSKFKTSVIIEQWETLFDSLP